MTLSFNVIPKPKQCHTQFFGMFLLDKVIPTFTIRMTQFNYLIPTHFFIFIAYIHTSIAVASTFSSFVSKTCWLLLYKLIACWLLFFFSKIISNCCRIFTEFQTFFASSNESPICTEFERFWTILGQFCDYLTEVYPFEVICGGLNSFVSTDFKTPLP